MKRSVTEWGITKRGMSQPLTPYSSLLTPHSLLLTPHFLSDPGRVTLGGKSDRGCDNFRYLVWVERTNASFEAGICRGAGLEQAIPLGGLLYRSLPAIHTRNGAEYLGAGRKPFGDDRVRDATRQLLRRNRGGDLKQRRQDGTLVSSPVLPSSMGTIAVRQPLLNVTVSRCPSGSGVISTMSAPNLFRA